MTILDLYASAIRSSNLKSEEITTRSHADVLGAAGLASKRHPLAIALARLFCGDNHASSDIVGILSEMAWGKAGAMSIDLKRTQADTMAQAVLAWHRDGVCKACGGHGFELIPGAPAVSDNHCPTCRGVGKVPFDSQFHAARRPVAVWLLAQVEREQGMAGPAALAVLSPRIEFE